MAVNKEDLKVGTVFEHRMGYLGLIVALPREDSDTSYEVIALTAGDSGFVEVSQKRWVLPQMMEYIIYQPEEAKTKADADKPEEKVELELGGVKVTMTYKQFEQFTKTFGKY